QRPERTLPLIGFRSREAYASGIRGRPLAYAYAYASRLRSNRTRVRTTSRLALCERHATPASIPRLAGARHARAGSPLKNRIDRSLAAFVRRGPRAGLLIALPRRGRGAFPFPGSARPGRAPDGLVSP